jgi:hypothetical protein
VIRPAWIRPAALALLACGVEAAQPLASHALPDLATAVYRIQAVDTRGRVSNGSAVLIAPGRLVTTCHVTRTAHSIQISQRDGTWSARPSFVDIGHDLCVLSAPDLAAPAPALIGTPGDLTIGDEVVAVGYRYGCTLAITTGKVKALDWYDGAPVLQVSASFDYGQSGGALFDASGRLVGITAFKAVAGGDFHFALPLGWLPPSAMLGDTVAGGGQDTGEKAFWQRMRDKQPLFLRAASLEAAGKWDALSEVAQEWVRADHANPASWLALGRAFSRLKRQRDADEAYRRAGLLAQSAVIPP